MKPSRIYVLWGAAAALALLGAYFAVLTFVSGRDFTLRQFAEFWYFIVVLAAGFGAQVGLYVRLKHMVHGGAGSGKVVATTGTTSAVAMVSCCAHYLVNVLPLLGATGIVAFAAAYQVKLFWVGIAFNLAGIVFVGWRVRMLSLRTHEVGHT